MDQCPWYKIDECKKCLYSMQIDVDSDLIFCDFVEKCEEQEKQEKRGDIIVDRQI